MKQFIFLVVSAGLLASCGTGKKLEAANHQITALTSSIDSLKKINTDYQQSVTQLKTENIQYSKEAEDCRKAKQAVSDRVDQFNKTLAENGTSMQAIKDKIQGALATFKDEGIAVKYKSGLVYVSMQDKLMFPSGSVVLNDAGKQALAVIADVMNEFPNLTTYVVGNTDTVMVAKKYKDNWSLSTERANTIVRVLRDKYGADPHQIVAAGRGKYDPIGDNSTEEGRAINRRIDIVLNPDLSRLWGMMEKGQ